MKRKIVVDLTNKQENFIRWLAIQDGASFPEELQKIFRDELDRLMELYGDYESKGLDF